MGTPRVMKLINPNTGEMECKVCGSRHVANLKPNSQGGGYHRGSWQCVNGCKLASQAQPEAVQQG